MSSSLGMLRRFCACRISLNLTCHSFADFVRALELINHHWRGWTSSDLLDPLRRRTNSPIHQALPFGAFGITRSKSVSPVQVSVPPSLGLNKDFASDGRPIHASSTLAIPGHCSPENLGFVLLSTSMCLTSIGGGSSGTSSGLKRVVRGTKCRRTR